MRARPSHWTRSLCRGRASNGSRSSSTSSAPKEHLKWVIPLALGIVFVLLYFNTESGARCGTDGGRPRYVILLELTVYPAIFALWKVRSIELPFMDIA